MNVNDEEKKEIDNDTDQARDSHDYFLSASTNNRNVESNNNVDNNNMIESKQDDNHKNDVESQDDMGSNNGDGNNNTGEESKQEDDNDEKKPAARPDDAALKTCGPRARRRRRQEQEGNNNTAAAALSRDQQMINDMSRLKMNNNRPVESQNNERDLPSFEQEDGTNEGDAMYLAARRQNNESDFPSFMEDDVGILEGDAMAGRVIPQAASLALASTANNNNKNAKEEKRTTAPSSNPDEETTGRRPGAHPSQLRPEGQIPVWMRSRRRQPQENENDESRNNDNSEYDSTMPVLSARMVPPPTVVDQPQLIEVAEPSQTLSEKSLKRRRRCLIAASIAVVLVLILAIAMIVSLVVRHRHNRHKNNNNNNDSPTTTPTPTPTMIPTLQRILQDNELSCGVAEHAGFSSMVNGTMKGFDADLCRAVAAAVLGDPNLVKFVIIKAGNERFQVLHNGTVDVLASMVTFTMERHVYERTTKSGFSFTIPYLYDGHRFGGDPFFVDCADNRNVDDDCRDLVICTMQDTTEYDILSARLPLNYLEVLPHNVSLAQALNEGRCNVVAGELLRISKNAIRMAGLNTEKNYTVGKFIFSKEPLAMVTRNDDPEWSDIVNLVVKGLLFAEANNITQATADRLEKPPSEFLGRGGQKLYFGKAIKAVGNYDEIYTRNLESLAKRSGLNLLNRGDTGLMLSYALGDVSRVGGMGRTVGGTLANVTESGILRCGLLRNNTNNESAAHLKNMDMDFCRAVAAASRIYIDAIEFEEFNDAKKAKQYLLRKSVDVVAGYQPSPRGESGLSFTQPYLYGPLVTDTGVKILGHQESIALATNDDDPHWSAFVFWVVGCTFFAEERNVSKATNLLLPEVNLFGDKWKRMFRDVSFFLDNYGEMYRRNLQPPMFSREGRNLKNLFPPGPQHYAPDLQ